MPDRLRITLNAQFFIAKADITNIAITSILNTATENKETDTEYLVEIFRTTKRHPFDNFEYIFSARAYPSSRPVYFFDEELSDRIHAFIIVIEFGRFIAILKKSCANISDTLEEHFDSVAHSTLTSTFDDDEVEFQKIALRNMTISDRAMRTRSYEAVDLKGLFSTHAAGRSIPYFFKIRQGSVLKTISANSGRVVESSERKNLDDIAAWVKTQMHLIENPSENKGFLDSFAKLVALDEVLAVTEPIAILIESSLLFDRIVRDNIQLLYKTRLGKDVHLSKGKQNILFQKLELVYELDNNLNVIDSTANSRLRKNEKSITFTSGPLKRIRLIENGKSITLQKYIIKNGLFSICFHDPKFMYFMGRCFEDSSGISEIDSILEILQPKDELMEVKSEKGVFDESFINFSADSMFSTVEAMHAADDYIFCDDLGNEWADHITLNSANSCITFIHSKHGNIETSASKLHEVVGQGIKNLGNMYFSKGEFSKKLIDKFHSQYKAEKKQTSIPRIRKGDCDHIDEYLNDLLHDFRLHRKCILSCSFLSKADITQEFNKIKRGQRVSGNVIQLLWIISSFAHASKDGNAIPIIYCQP